MGIASSQEYQERTPLTSQAIPSKQSLIHEWKVGYLKLNEEKRKESLSKLINVSVTYNDIFDLDENILTKSQKEALWSEYNNAKRK